MQIWPHSRMDWKKEIKRRGCVVLTHPLFHTYYIELLKLSTKNSYKCYEQPRY